MLETLRQHLAAGLQRLSVRLERTGTVEGRVPCVFAKGCEQMKRPWKVPFRKNRKLQNCLALSLALHLLVIFGITHRERVRSGPKTSNSSSAVLGRDLLIRSWNRTRSEVYQTAAAAAHSHPSPTAHAAPIGAPPSPASHPARRDPSRSLGVASVAGVQDLGSSTADGVAAGSTGAAGAGFPRSAHWAADAGWGVGRNAAGGRRD